jgi:IclR family transcriptional regulator, acetate operon repressor
MPKEEGPVQSLKKQAHVSAKSPYAGPRAPVRVMQIVETLAESPEGVSLALLAERLAVPKTSALNHLRVMLGTGHVAIQDARYVLGPSAIRLGTIIVAGSSELAALAPMAGALAEQSGETTLVAMLDEGTREAVYVKVLEGRQPIRYSPAIGTRRPLYCTAVGRALLAFQSEAYVRAYFQETKIRRFNARTVINQGRLMKILDQVRALGMAVTSEEHTVGVGGIAAPVFDRTGRARYAVGLGLASAKVALDRERFSRFVLAAGKSASWALGARTEHSDSVRKIS